MNSRTVKLSSSAGPMRAVVRGLDRVLDGSSYLAVSFVIISAFLVAIDVLLRKIFNSPTNWVFEYSLYLIATGIYLSFAFVLRQKGHIAVDLLTSRLDKRSSDLLRFFTLLMSFALILVLAYSGMRLLQRSVATGDVSNTIMETPLWIPQVPLVLGFALFALQLLRMIVEQGLELRASTLASETRSADHAEARPIIRPLLPVTGFIVLMAVEAAMIWSGGSLRIVGVMLFLLTGLASGMPIFLALALTGGLAFYFILGGGLGFLSQLAPLGHQVLMSTTFTAIPLFIFGAGVLGVSGLTDKLFDFFRLWLPGIRGKLAIVTILACGVFAACSGSSVATAGAFAVVALPLMLASNYDKRLAYGTLAAGGTLGPMIPPSISPILFGQLTGLSVGALLIAGILPGILMMVVFSVYIAARCFRNPRYDGDVASAGVTAQDRLRAMRRAAPAIGAPIIVMGGIYSGLATPTEAASLLVVYGIIVSLILLRGKNLISFKQPLLSSLTTSGMVYAITFAAAIFSATLSFLRVPEKLAEVVVSMNVPPTLVVVGIMALLLVLGMFMDPIAILVVTVPILYPIVDSLGFNGIWFATLFNLNLEVGMLTPPVGMNLFVLAGASGARLGDVVRGTLPFMGLLVLCLVILFLVPQLATWLPSLMGY